LLISKIVATRAVLFGPNIHQCTKSFVGWGFATDPTGRAYSALPLMGREKRREREKKKEKWKGGRREETPICPAP